MSRAMERTTVTVEDVGGRWARFCREAPREVRKMLGTAVFLTQHRVRTTMEANAPEGEGGGLTPDEHIKLDIDSKWNASNPLTARVGIFDNDAQAHVALWNEYIPNEQPFMRPALLSQESSFHAEAIAALKSLERMFAI